MFHDRIVDNAQQINDWYKFLHIKQQSEVVQLGSGVPTPYSFDKIPHVVVGRQNIVDLQSYLESLRENIREQN